MEDIDLKKLVEALEEPLRKSIITKEVYEYMAALAELGKNQSET